jgi:hypothetical protein
LKNLQNLNEIPVVLKEGVFKKLFQVADLAGMNRQERQNYEESLKYYRDLKNANDTAKNDGIIEGILKGKIEGKAERDIEIVISNYKKGQSNEIIALFTDMPLEKVIQIIQDYQREQETPL